MPIRKILVPVDGSAEARSSLETAIAMGRHLSAHVEALHVRPDPRDAIPLVGEGMSGAMIEELITITEDEAASRAAQAKTLFDEVCTANAISLADAPAPKGLSARWREEIGREDEVTMRHGRLADLVVVAHPMPRLDNPSRITLNAALFETGRPVLVSPLNAPAAIGRNIAVSWNASAEAARAVAAALPLFEKADSTIILTIVSDGAGEEAGGELADYLAWHGITATHRAVSADDGPVGAAVLKACAEVDLLVMGAYTHSRLRQLILGGTTRHILEHAELTLLMAH